MIYLGFDRWPRVVLKWSTSGAYRKVFFLPPERDSKIFHGKVFTPWQFVWAMMHICQTIGEIVEIQSVFKVFVFRLMHKWHLSAETYRMRMIYKHTRIDRGKTQTSPHSLISSTRCAFYRFLVFSPEISKWNKRSCRKIILCRWQNTFTYLAVHC